MYSQRPGPIKLVSSDRFLIRAASPPRPALARVGMRAPENPRPRFAPSTGGGAGVSIGMAQVSSPAWGANPFQLLTGLSVLLLIGCGCARLRRAGRPREAAMLGRYPPPSDVTRRAARLVDSASARGSTALPGLREGRRGRETANRQAPRCPHPGRYRRLASSPPLPSLALRLLLAGMGERAATCPM